MNTLFATLWRTIAVAGALAPVAFAQFPPACVNFPNQCLYTPGGTFAYSTSNLTATYKDLVDDPRSLLLTVRIPAVPAGAMPVVVWSPGVDAAGTGNTDMSRWSDTTAKAGYLTITVTHPIRSKVDRMRLCAELHVKYGYPARDCAVLNPVNWDWPVDLRHVIDWLEQANFSGPPEIRGRIDLRRIAVGGFVEGANGAISLAGATRLLTTDNRAHPNSFTDARPVAFIELSPQGPRLGDAVINHGFYDWDLLERNSSWDNIGRPVLTVSGAGDNSCPAPATCYDGDSPSRRKIGYHLMPGGGKYQMYVKSTKMSHGFVGTMDVAACAAAGIANPLCNQFDQWLRSTVVAYLDWNVRQNAAAQFWLTNELIEPASANVVDWQLK